LSSAKRISKPALALLTVAVLISGCQPAPATGDRTVDVRGTVTRTMAGSGPDGWVLQVDGGMLLPLELPGNPVVGGHCVTIAVDDDFTESTDESDVIAALLEVVEQTGESLVVTAYC
jgi:hypothetical protein